MTESSTEPDARAKHAEPGVEETYEVNLMMNVRAQDAGHAVRAFIEGLTQKGLRDWAFGVHLGESSLGVFDGYGNDVTEMIAEAQAQKDAQADTEADTAADPETDGQPISASVEQVSQDAELLALADQLNASE